MIKSYRGRLADGATDSIPLHTNDGKTGYKIIKFELMPGNPTNDNIEVIIQVWKTAAAAAGASAIIDFADNTLIAAGYIEDNAGDDNTFHTDQVIFDQETFNQDIFVTSTAPTASTDGVNYYIELEQMDLTEDQALVAIVKNLRNEQ
jgi:malate/lactate dehydrogenase|tara:strand:- start:51 stop:491 length:441 start_codon:yes stop_codon:yes gene_type:complete